jgi:hypothetical protein
MKSKNSIWIYLIIIQSVISLLFLSIDSLAQAPSSEICFIKLNEKMGYIIDADENKQCKCVTNFDINEYNYAALIQLPDSSIVLRIMLVDSLGSRDIAMEKTEVEKLHSSASFAVSPVSSLDASNEEEFLHTLAEGTVGYKKADYDQLKFPSLDKNRDSKQHSLGFINIGFGDATIHHQTNSALGIELGFVYKKQIFSIRGIHLKEALSKANTIGSIEKIIDVGFLYGRQLDFGGILLISASAGIAYTGGVVRGDVIYRTYNPISIFTFYTDHYEEKTFQTIGLPLQIEIIPGARYKLGFSFILFGNINQNYSYGGFLVCLRLGKVSGKNKF